MFISSFVTLFVCVFSLVLAGPAPFSKDNPKNIVAVADFPESGPNKYTKGYVYFTSPKGDSIKVHVDMTGLPTSGGPFVYHIHEGQIFDKKSCDEAGKHFDPFNGFVHCPEKGDDAFCMVGDLAGKHGFINATCFQTEYHDKYISLNPASEAYIVGRSLVFHDQTQTRFACANINLANAEQYEYLFGAPGKNPSSSTGASESSPHPPAQKPLVPEPLPVPAAPVPAPNPVPPVPPTPTSSSSHPSPVPIKASEPPVPPASKPVEPSSTAGAKVNPTSSVEKGEKSEGGNKFFYGSADTSSPSVLLSSDAASGNFFRGAIGTIFGVLLGFFF
ncbi:hypothetical protein JCM33374_g1532 [Metschnikowia sp. JCM 33374]|nr:hypothetical protein JCM33374_g1532 [Metschnikowia sp. JCM 33374]